MICSFVCTVSCQRTESTAHVNSRALARGVVARVGPLSITGEMVEASARATRSSATQALQRIVQDALLAAEARTALTQSSEVHVIEATVLARALLEDIRQRARARGLPSNEELASATQRRWVELDRPSSARTTHAVALVKRPQQAAEARAVAERIARATRGATDAEEFKRRALAVSRGTTEVTAESLPPITEAGRAVPVVPGAEQGSGSFDARFARAANALLQPGEQSDPVESDFGWHVIRLEERLPAVRLPVEERRRAVADDVYRERASREREQLLKTLRARLQVVVTRNATELTGLLKAEP